MLFSSFGVYFTVLLCATSRYFTMISMDDSIDDYVTQLEATIRRTAEARSRNERTTDYTVTRFDQTRLDRLWQMKVDKKLVDSVLVCPEDGHREVVHMDMIIGLDEDMVPFYEKSPNRSEEGLVLYNIDPTISSNQLKSIIYFAYNRRCELNEKLAMSLSEASDKFDIYSLLDYCLTFLREHIHDGIAVQTLELVLSVNSLPELMQFFQNYVEDRFDQLWLTNRPDFMGLTYDTLHQLLTSDWLNLESESTPWQVIQAWIGHEPESRLSQMASLIKGTLRFGRIPSSFNIRQSIVSCSLFQSQPIEVRQESIDFITQVLDEAIRSPKPIDENGLPYDESTYNYRPRNPKQLLILAGGLHRWPLYQDIIQLYDYHLNLWRTSQVTLPEKLRSFDTQIIGSTMYVLGGWNQFGCNREVFSLDLSKAEPKWVTVPPMLNHRRTVASVVYKGKLVVIGGADSNFTGMVQCEQYDPSTRVWTEFAPLNRARYYCTATVHNERIYFAGGYSATVEMYDHESNQWKLIAPMNIERIDLTLVNYLDQVLAVSGLSAAANSIESYNPTTNLWTIETSVSLQPKIYQGVQLNEELLVTGYYGGLYTIRNLGPNARVIQLSSPAEILFSSVAVVSSRLAVAFYKT